VSIAIRRPIAAAIATQELHPVSHHFKRRTDRTIVPSPQARGTCVWVWAQPSFDKYLTTFLQILVSGFSLTSPHRDAVPGDFFHLLPRNAVIPAPVTSQRKVGHSLPIGHIFHFRVTAQITNDDEFLIHVSLSLNLNWVDKKLISSGAIAPLAGPTSPFAFRQRLA
jgi:hypothetical protein